MLSRERQQHILELLESQQVVRIPELTERFGVSEVTIRRDLRALARSFGVERVRGGAFLTRRELGDSPLHVRQVVNLQEKRRIGRAAAQLVEDGDTIIIGGGTTCAELARSLGDRRNLVVITLALNVAYILADFPGITVLVTGGMMVGPELTLAGYIGEQTLRALHADKLFLGANAFDLLLGLTTSHPSEIGISRAMIEAARERILLIDHTKFNRVSTCMIGRTDELNCIITDGQAPDDVVARIRELSIKVVIA